MYGKLTFGGKDITKYNILDFIKFLKNFNKVEFTIAETTKTDFIDRLCSVYEETKLQCDDYGELTPVLQNSFRKGLLVVFHDQESWKN